MSIAKLLAVFASIFNKILGFLERQEIKKSERDRIERDALADNLDMVRDEKEIEDKVDTMSDEDLQSEADKWLKD